MTDYDVSEPIQRVIERVLSAVTALDVPGYRYSVEDHDTYRLAQTLTNALEIIHDLIAAYDEGSLPIQLRADAKALIAA